MDGYIVVYWKLINILTCSCLEDVWFFAWLSNIPTLVRLSLTDKAGTSSFNFWYSFLVDAPAPSFFPFFSATPPSSPSSSSPLLFLFLLGVNRSKLTKFDFFSWPFPESSPSSHIMSPKRKSRRINMAQDARSFFLLKRDGRREKALISPGSSKLGIRQSLWWSYRTFIRMENIVCKKEKSEGLEVQSFFSVFSRKWKWEIGGRVMLTIDSCHLSSKDPKGLQLQGNEKQYEEKVFNFPQLKQEFSFCMKYTEYFTVPQWESIPKWPRNEEHQIPFDQKILKTYLDKKRSWRWSSFSKKPYFTVRSSTVTRVVLTDFHRVFFLPPSFLSLPPSLSELYCVSAQAESQPKWSFSPLHFFLPLSEQKTSYMDLHSRPMRL